MDTETEVIHQQMEETRTALQDKLETLEQQVTQTVQHATETVSETVDTVKEAVQDTVDSVKESLDLRYQVERHPWAMFFGAALAGCAAARLLNRPAAPTAAQPTAAFHNGHAPVAGGLAAAMPALPGRSLWNIVADEYHEELDKVKGLAVATVGGIVREMLVASAPPPMAEEIKDIVDSVTVKLGGHSLTGPILNLEPHLQPLERTNGIHRDGVVEGSLSEFGDRFRRTETD